jgi:hypothetical protein
MRQKNISSQFPKKLKQNPDSDPYPRVFMGTIYADGNVGLANEADTAKADIAGRGISLAAQVPKAAFREGFPLSFYASGDHAADQVF